MNDVRQQKWAEAEAKLLAAFELNRSYDIAANLGQAQVRLGKHREAAEHLAFALRAWPVIGNREPRERAVKRLAELRRVVASVTVRVSAPGATVLVDGKEVGRSPLDAEVFVDPGQRVIEAKLEGYEPAKVAVEAVAGTAREVPIALVRTSSSAASPSSTAASTSPGGSARNVGAARTGPVAAEERPAPVEEAKGASKGLIIAGAATSALMVGTGIVFVAVANGKATDAEEKLAAVRQQTGMMSPCWAGVAPRPAECSRIEELVADKGVFGSGAFWMILAGGVLGAGTAVYALMGASDVDKRSVVLAPVVTEHVGGAVLSGKW